MGSLDAGSLDQGNLDSFLIQVGDETTALTGGAGKATFRIPYPFRLTDIRASVTTAPTGDTKSSATVTIASPVANTFATGTVTCAAVEAGDTVTANGLLYTAVAGAKANNEQFSIDTGNNECAADLADSITSDTRSGTVGDLTATSSTDTVTITTDVLGTDGNAVTLVSSNGTRLAVSGSGTFTGGVSADTVTVNGLVYTAVAGAKSGNTQFSIDSTDTATAIDLADSITNDVRIGTDVATVDPTATNTDAVITITATVFGVIGDSINLASSDGGRLAVSGANLAGGINPLTVDVNVNGSSILSTKITVDASEKTSKTAIIPKIISNDTLETDDEVKIDLDDIGGTVAGAGLKIYLIGNRK